MDITKEKPSIEDFLQIYPNTSLKFEPNEKDQLIKLFNIINRIKRKKSSVILDMNQIQKLMKEQKKTKISSLNFENKAILSIEKINKNNNENENGKKGGVFYRILQEEEDVEKFVDKLNEDFFLINKGIEQQKRNIKRTSDVKKALELFFEKSELIQRLAKSYGINNSKNPLEDKNVSDTFKERIKKLISNLANSVLLEKYEKDKFIIRKNDIGKDCYFLLSGRLSILKPVEYKFMKLTYEEYLKYLVNLKYHKEEKIFETVTNTNWLFMKVYNEENLLEIIKYYIQKRISIYSNISYDISDKTVKEDLTLENIEAFLLEYKLKLEDFGISKEKILEDLKKIQFNESSEDFQLLMNDYFKDIFKIDKKTQMLYSIYDYLFEKEEKDKGKLVTLYKYETFLTLSPGAFFGEMSLDSENKKRNASIRTETDCVVASLSIEKYANYLMDENKKILTRQINFLCNNFFFNNISPKIFSKYYFSMFKLININKDTILYEQGNNCNSIFFIREGTIKYEINASISELHNLIVFLISGLRKSKTFKLSNQFVDELKNKYLRNHTLINMRNASIILIEKINKIQTFELNISESYEVLGLPEFFFELPHICSCSVISQNVRLFELNRYNLNHIVSFEKAIKEDLYKLILDKIIIFIARLFNIENNFVNNVNSKINSNFFNIRDTHFFDYINQERDNKLFNFDNNNKDLKVEEEKNKKYINEKENLIIKKYAKIGYVGDDTIKKSFYTPIKFKKKIINPKLISDLKYLNSSRSYPILNINKIDEENQTTENQKSKNKNDNNNLSIDKEKNNINPNSSEKKEKTIKIKEPQNLIIKNKLNHEKNNTSIHDSNISDSKSTNNTLIKIGKSYVSLPKLRKLIISSGKPKEKHMSIVQNRYDDLEQISENQYDLALNENKTLFNKQNNKSDKICLPEIGRQNSCQLFQTNKRIKRKINKTIDYKDNYSEMSEKSIKEDINKKNILARYIKNFYQKQKMKGYSAFLNPKYNTLMKKKMNKNLVNIIKK